MRNGNRSFNEVAEINLPWTLLPGNLGPHLAPPPTWHIILDMRLNLAEPGFYIEVIIASLVTSCC